MNLVIRNDYYSTDRARLRGMPKSTMGRYVERTGKPVPRMFKTFEHAKEAADSGIKIIARSEHEQEYGGASGLCASHVFGDRRDFEGPDQLPWGAGRLVEGAAIDLFRNEDEFKRRAFATQRSSCQQYCDLVGIDIKDFRNQVTWSYWEYLEGANRAVVADSAVSGRYHVMTTFGTSKNYVIIEDGMVIIAFETKPLMPLTPELREGLLKLIELYEDIRALRHFNPNHCPMMEFQTVGTVDYFLQYHRTRDFEPCPAMDITPEKGDLEAIFVRGSTNGERRIYRTPMYWQRPKTIEPHEGYIDDGVCSAYGELLMRKTKLLIDTSNRRQFLQFAHNMACSHSPRSKLFKPEISIVVPHDDLFNWAKTAEVKKRSLAERATQYVNFSVISDGRRAFIRMI